MVRVTKIMVERPCYEHGHGCHMAILGKKKKTKVDGNLPSRCDNANIVPFSQGTGDNINCRGFIEVRASRLVWTPPQLGQMFF